MLLCDKIASPMSHGKHRSLLALPREGEHFREVYRIDRDGVVEDVQAPTFNTAHHIDGIIRIVGEEYLGIDTSLPYLTHFNLEFSGHRIGAIYALPKIMKRGYYRSLQDEVPPTLSFRGALVGVCVGVREHTPYRALQEKDFRYSMSHIQTVEQLQEAIILRYFVSMPNLSKREILERGVAITTLRLEGVLKEGG